MAGCHRVSGVVEAVDKFEAEGDEEGNSKQNERKDGSVMYRAQIAR